MNKNAFELYKNHYFVPLENKFISFFYNIIEKAENLKIDDKDDENIIKYINILSSFDIPNPKLQKINKYQYIWIDVEGKKVNRENYNNFLLKILLFFADNIFDELKNLTIPEYLSNYLEIYIRKNIYFKKYFYLYNNYYFLAENAYEYFIEKNIDKIEEYFFTCDKKAIIKFYQSNEFYYIETLIKEYFLYSFKKRGEKAFDKINKYFDELRNEKIYSDNDIEKLILKFNGVLGKEGDNKIYKKKKNSEKKENKRELTKQKKFRIFNLEKEEEIEEAKEKEKPELIEKECWIFDIWFNKLLNDTINFIKLKVNNYEMLSIHEYIIFSVNYYDSLYNLYKNYFYEHYFNQIMDIFYKYLYENKLEQIEDYYFNCNKDEIILLLKKNKNKKGFAKLIGECFVFSSKKRGINILEKKIIKNEQDKYAFVELIRKLKTIFNCLKDSKEFHTYFYNGLVEIFNKQTYSKELAYFYNDCMRRGFKGKSTDYIEKEIENILEIFGLLTDKCYFKIIIEKQMSDRLINNLSLSLDVEKKFILNLKNKAGFNYTEKMITMINDMEKNKIIKEEYNNLYNDSHEIKFNVTVISQDSWDIKLEYLEKIELPKFLLEISNDFQKFYNEKFHHKLIWCLYLSKVDIKYLCFSNNNNNYISKSTLIQLLILLLIEKYNKISIKTIAEILGCKIGLVLKDISGLIFNPSFNPNQEKDKGIILGNFDEKSKEFKENDEFWFNFDFNIQNIKFNTLPLNIKKSEKETKMEEQESKMVIQKYQNNIIQATLARIMKSKVGQKVDHIGLINEVSKQIIQFQAQPQQIKENIEKLIEKNIISRAKDNNSCYEYIS